MGNIFFKKLTIVSVKTVSFLETKKIDVGKYIFEKSSRMVATMFSADVKSASRTLVSLRKIGGIDWLKFFKKSTRMLVRVS